MDKSNLRESPALLRSLELLAKLSISKIEDGRDSVNMKRLGYRETKRKDNIGWILVTLIVCVRSYV